MSSKDFICFGKNNFFIIAKSGADEGKERERGKKIKGQKVR
jgi:hypothetical protein